MSDERPVAERARAFAVRVIRLFNALPRTQVARVLGGQFLRSGTAPGAHLREGRRARSNAEMISKFETAVQELDETLYWFELLIDAELVPATRLQPLMNEANELIAILVASIKTLKQRR
jgi:four helix bundle protein